MKDKTKKYSNGEVTVVWKPATCIHSTICWKGITGLSSVFNPAERPWIKPEGASTQAIINQDKLCPSGALTYFLNDEVEAAIEAEPSKDIARVEVKPNGPLLFHGNCIVIDNQGNESIKENVTAFCRCGHSTNKPYCDGSHRKEGFVG